MKSTRTRRSLTATDLNPLRQQASAGISRRRIGRVQLPGRPTRNRRTRPPLASLPTRRPLTRRRPTPRSRRTRRRLPPSPTARPACATRSPRALLSGVRSRRRPRRAPQAMPTRPTLPSRHLSPHIPVDRHRRRPVVPAESTEKSAPLLFPFRGTRTRPPIHHFRRHQHRLRLRLQRTATPTPLFRRLTTLDMAGSAPHCRRPITRPDTERGSHMRASTSEGGTRR